MTQCFHPWNKFHATNRAWIASGTRTASSTGAKGCPRGEKVSEGRKGVRTLFPDFFFVSKTKNRHLINRFWGFDKQKVDVWDLCGSTWGGMTQGSHAWNKFHATNRVWISSSTRTASCNASSRAAIRSRVGFGSAPRQVTLDQTLSLGPSRAAIAPNRNDRWWAGRAVRPGPLSPYPGPLLPHPGCPTPAALPRLPYPGCPTLAAPPRPALPVPSGPSRPVRPFPSRPADFDAPEPWCSLCVRPSLW
jgi:hypothetical protein